MHPQNQTGLQDIFTFVKYTCTSMQGTKQLHNNTASNLTVRHSSDAGFNNYQHFVSKKSSHYLGKSLTCPD
jgi:hypothetical protein